MGPGPAAVLGAPDPRKHAPRGYRREQDVPSDWIELDLVAPIASGRGEGLSSPCRSAVTGRPHAVGAATVRNAAKADVPGVVGIDRDRADTGGKTGVGGSGQRLPVVPAVGRAEQTDAGMGIGGEVGLPGPAIDDVGIAGTKGEGADVERRVLVPQGFPVAPAVGAAPDPAAGGAGDDPVRIGGMTNQRRHPPADIGRADEFPLRLTASRGELGRDPPPLSHQREARCLAQRPGLPRTEPVGPLLMGRQIGFGRADEALLTRTAGKLFAIVPRFDSHGPLPSPGFGFEDRSPADEVEDQREHEPGRQEGQAFQSERTELVEHLGGQKGERKRRCLDNEQALQAGVTDHMVHGHSSSFNVVGRKGFGPVVEPAPPEHQMR